MQISEQLVHDGILVQLTECKFITQEQIVQFLRDQRISFHDHITVSSLLSAGRITDEQIAQCMAIRSKIGYVNLKLIEIPSKHIKLIEPDVANFLRCIPFADKNGNLHVAIENPMDERKVENVQYMFDNTPLAICTTSGMNYALEKWYPTKGYEIPPKSFLKKKNAAGKFEQPGFQLN